MVINGELLFNDSKCSFSFNKDKYILEIYCMNGEAKYLFLEEVEGIKGLTISTNKKDIASNRLEGILYGNKEHKIVFYIQTSGYGHSGGIDFEKVVLRIYVLMYITISSIIGKENHLVFGSKQFHKFLNLIPNYFMDNADKDKLAEVRYFSDAKKHKADFVYNNDNFTVYPCAKYSMGGTKFDFIPQLVLKPNRHLSEDEILFFADKFIDLFQFLFMRINVIPDSISYSNDNYQFELYYNKTIDYVDETENINSFKSYGFISWLTIYNHLQQIMDDFFTDSVFLKNVEIDSESRKQVGFTKISSYSAFFEYTYSLIYGNVIKHKNSSQKEIDLIVETLNSIKDETRRNLNKKIDYLISQLDHVALSTKIQKVFRDYKNCLLIVKTDFGLNDFTNEAIANLCANIRNWTDHGDKKATIDQHIASCFAYLNCSTYAMYLRRWGINDETIAHQLHNLYLV